MKTITTTADLLAFCKKCATQSYVTVDTEFLREKSYYSKLCLIQMAYPGKGDEDAVLIDPLAKELSLDPLYELFENEDVVKVFHAARQDLEIFFVDKKIIPKPLFDTQIAAMVCGYGEQVGYEKLVRSICSASIDKSSRFTDWSLRPLSSKQKEYALADVTFLRQIYERLSKEIEKTNRSEWVSEELNILLRKETYLVDPKEAWRRVKMRNNSPKMLSAVVCLAEFRESYAQTKNVPRSRVYKDDALLELAATKPSTFQDLGKSRLLHRDARKGPIAEGILQAVERAKSFQLSKEDLPAKKRDRSHVNDGLNELLRVLLKAKAEKYSVATKLIATSDDLEKMASGDWDVKSVKGWRAEVFGNDAKRLSDGQVALSTSKGKVVVIET